MKLLLSCGILLRDDLSLKPTFDWGLKTPEAWGLEGEEIPELLNEMNGVRIFLQRSQMMLSCKTGLSGWGTIAQSRPHAEIEAMIRNYLTVQTLQSPPGTCVGRSLWKLWSTFLEFSKRCRKIQKLKAQQRFMLVCKYFCETVGFGIGGRWRGAKQWWRREKWSYIWPKPKSKLENPSGVMWKHDQYWKLAYTWGKQILILLICLFYCEKHTLKPVKLLDLFHSFAFI